ncbi:MAG: terpene utilization protein AtuA, partial [Terricaulis sp.]
ARLFSFTLSKPTVSIEVDVDGKASAFVDIAEVYRDRSARPQHEAPDVGKDDASVAVPLIALAWARSGDKGDKANIGIIARRPDYFPYICRSLTREVVAERFSHFLQGGVERFVLPGPHALNFLLHNVLGGGGAASLRNDPQGKGYSQLLLEVPIKTPRALVERDKLPTL